MFIHNLNWVVTKCLPPVKLVKLYFQRCKILWGLTLVIRDFKKCMWKPGQNNLWLITPLILSWLNLLIFIANLWIWRKEKVGDKMLKLWNWHVLSFQSSFPLWRQDLRKENWLKVIFCSAQICPCLGFYGGFLVRYSSGYSKNHYS